MSGKHIALITGSGFSKEAKLPLTSELSADFVGPENDASRSELDRTIDDILRGFWREVFAYASGNPPAFEDHFTMLDLAANAGHNLGSQYTPRQLRAIRRFSIHRVFDVLNRRYDESDAIKKLLDRLNTGERKLTVVTLNWDIVAELHLAKMNSRFRYAGNVRQLRNSPTAGASRRPRTCGPRERSGPDREVLICKMHGSANWGYCDICRKWWYTRVEMGKSALHQKVLLEKRDFDLFEKELSEVFFQDKLKCPDCERRLSTRVGTFSFRKDLAQFHAVWDGALQALREAEIWLFVGYSLPEADYEFKHLLKTAQLAHRLPDGPQIEVVLKDGAEPQKRYERFFGERMGCISQCGLSSWVDRRLIDFLEEGA